MERFLIAGILMVSPLMGGQTSHVQKSQKNNFKEWWTGLSPEKKTAVLISSGLVAVGAGTLGAAKYVGSRQYPSQAAQEAEDLESYRKAVGHETGHWEADYYKR